MQLYPYESCQDAAITLRQRLLSNSRLQGVAAKELDLSYVSRRAVNEFRAISTVGDVGGKSHRAIIHNKTYLKGDYEDPEFIMEWTLIQMLASSAPIYGDIVEGYTDRLFGALRDSGSPSPDDE